MTALINALDSGWLVIRNSKCVSQIKCAVLDTVMKIIKTKFNQSGYIELLSDNLFLYRIEHKVNLNGKQQLVNFCHTCEYVGINCIYVQ